MNKMEIKSVRERLGMSPDQFAIAIGLSSVTIRTWETGQRKPGKLALKRLSELQRRAERKSIVSHPVGTVDATTDTKTESN